MEDIIKDMGMTKIKICGITKKEEALILNDVKVDYAGFVFYPKSKRNIELSQATEIFSTLSPDIKRVAVMVSPTVEDVCKVQDKGFDILQIHKDLDSEVIEAAKLPIWYAVNIENEEEYRTKADYISSLSEDYKSKIEAIVVDAPLFGSGKPFNWRKSKRLKKAGSQSPPENETDGASELINNRMFVLAGGLNESNVKEGITLFNPDVVDVSSGVEGECGKDKDKIVSFVKAVRE